jgi:F-type H+-transporting ATPase subunit b
MPQINQLLLVYQSQWFWLLLVLGVIYFVIGHGMLPKIEKTVDDRDAKIAGDLAAAEKARAAADDAEERAKAADVDARASAQGVAAQAKAKSAKDAENRLAKADGEIAAKVAAAEATLAKARDKALGSLESVASEAALDIVAKVSGAKVTATQAGKAVKAVLSNA